VRRDHAGRGAHTHDSDMFIGIPVDSRRGRLYRSDGYISTFGGKGRGIDVDTTWSGIPPLCASVRDGFGPWARIRKKQKRKRFGPKHEQNNRELCAVRNTSGVDIDDSASTPKKKETGVPKRRARPESTRRQGPLPQQAGFRPGDACAVQENAEPMP